MTELTINSNGFYLLGILRSMEACDPYPVAFARGKWSSSDTGGQQNHRAQDLSKTTTITLNIRIYNYDSYRVYCFCELHYLCTEKSFIERPLHKSI